MLAGRLRERITLQAKSVARDAYGGEVVTWAEQATVWAAVEPITGREVHAAQQLNSEVTLRVRIRYRSDVAATWRALWGSIVLSIHAVLPGPRRDESVLLCSQGVRDA